MKRLPKDLKTMAAEVFHHEYNARQKYLSELEETLMSRHRLHSEETALAIAENQRHTKTAQKYFKVKKELERMGTIFEKLEHLSKSR